MQVHYPEQSIRAAAPIGGKLSLVCVRRRNGKAVGWFWTSRLRTC